MNGYTPFGGIAEKASASQASPGLGNDAIRRNNYCFKPGLKPQAAAIPQLDAFPEDIAELFSRAFMVLGKIDPTQRPSAIEWRNSIDIYINDEDYITCVNNPLHQYDGKKGRCPYCKADQEYPDSLIPNKQVAYSQSIKPPVLIPTSSPITSSPIYSPSRENWWQRLSKRAKSATIIALICVVVLSFGSFNGWFSGNNNIRYFNPNDNIVLEDTNAPLAAPDQPTPIKQPSISKSKADDNSSTEIQRQTNQDDTTPLLV